MSPPNSTEHGDPHRARTKLGSFAIGLVHGMGGSAGVGILLVASIQVVTDRVAPGLGVASFAFAIWYGAAAWTLRPLSVLNAARAQLARRSSPYGTRMTSPRIMRFVFVAHPAVKAR